MSIVAHRYVSAVLGDGAPGLNTLDRLVLWVLADHADQTGVAWPAIQRVADYAGVHPSSARRSLQRLVAAGVVAVDDSVGGRGHTSRYRFPLGPSTTLAPARGFDDPQPSRPGAQTLAIDPLNPRAGASRSIEPLYEPRADPLDDDPPDAPTVPTVVATGRFDVRGWADTQRLARGL